MVLLSDCKTYDCLYNRRRSRYCEGKPENSRKLQQMQLDIKLSEQDINREQVLRHFAKLR